MSFPTRSKDQPKVTEEEIHQAPTSPTPQKHEPVRAASYGDEKSRGYDTMESSHENTSSNTSETTSDQIFRTALGMPKPKQPKNGKNADQPVLSPKNEGVYQKVISCERSARWKYLFCDFSVTIAMFLQIVVGASVTAFGAGNSSHILITCFGAANTALASLLAVLKSQGLPNRMRQDWNAWRQLREEIEENERQIEMSVSGRVPGAKGVEKSDVWNMVQAIEARYTEVRSNVEANRPDTYIPVKERLPKK